MDIHQAAEQRKVDIKEMVQEMKKKIADYTENMERTKQSFRKSRERIASTRNSVMTSVAELQLKPQALSSLEMISKII